MLRGAWSDKPFSYGGDHYRTDGLDLAPRPVQRPHPPLLLGGGGPIMLRFAAREADIVNITNQTAADGRGVAPADVGLAPLLAKLALVREATAERPVPPEVSVGVRATAIGRSMGPIHPAVADQVDALRGTPFLLEGSIGESPTKSCTGIRSTASPTSSSATTPMRSPCSRSWSACARNCVDFTASSAPRLVLRCQEVSHHPAYPSKRLVDFRYWPCPPEPRHYG